MTGKFRMRVFHQSAFLRYGLVKAFFPKGPQDVFIFHILLSETKLGRVVKYLQCGLFVMSILSELPESEICKTH